MKNIFEVEFRVTMRRAPSRQLVGQQLDHLLTVLTQGLDELAARHEFSFEPIGATIKRVSDSD